MAITVCNLFIREIHSKFKTVLFWILQSVLIVGSQLYTKLVLSAPDGLLLVLSLPAAYVCYGISLFIVGTRFSLPNLFFFPLKDMQGEMRTAYRKESLMNIFTSLYEEFLFRGLFQVTVFQITKSSILTVLISCLFFALSHYHKRIAIVQMLDILVFSLIITILLELTQDIWICILLHIFRNFFIINQKYVYLIQRKRRIHQITKRMNGVG